MRLIGGAAIAFVLTLTCMSVSAPAQGQRLQDGQAIFRFDTFGDEQLWTDFLKMNDALETVSPATALSVGLKVDVRALPPAVIKMLKADEIDLNDPAVTLTLLKLNAVVGVMGKVNDAGELTRVGITCALCHSTVDNSLTTGIGRRLDGWPNHDLNVGAIVGLSPALPADLKAEFAKWGPGMYDPRHHAFDGMNLTGLNSPSVPVVIPPAYGLKGVGFETYTGDGPISYWNAYVGISQMGGQGTFRDPRIGLFIRDTGSRHPEVSRAVPVSTRSASTRAARGQLQSTGGAARKARVLQRWRMRELSLRIDVHRCVEGSTERPAVPARSI